MNRSGRAQTMMDGNEKVKTKGPGQPRVKADEERERREAEKAKDEAETFQGLNRRGHGGEKAGGRPRRDKKTQKVHSQFLSSESRAGSPLFSNIDGTKSEGSMRRKGTKRCFLNIDGDRWGEN